MNDHPSQQPEPYSHKRRLADQCADAREVLAAADLTIHTMGMAAYAGKLEAQLGMLADSAESVLASFVPNLGETSDALAGKLDDLPDRDLHWLLCQMAYGSPERQRALSDLLAALEAWKRDNPQHGNRP